MALWAFFAVFVVGRAVSPLPGTGLLIAAAFFLLSSTASRCRSFRSCSTRLGSCAQPLECRLSSCGTGSLLHCLWNLPGSGLNPCPCAGSNISSTALPQEVWKITFFNLIVQYLKSTVAQHNSRHTGPASGEQARRVADWRRKWRWKLVEPRDHQQQRWRVGCNFTHAWRW